MAQSPPQPLVNRVQSSGLITIDLSTFLPENLTGIDMASFLEHGFILREKPYREQLKQMDFSVYADKQVYIFCSTDAIIPSWAAMLLAIHLKKAGAEVIHAENTAQASELFALRTIWRLPLDEWKDKKVVIKGCGGNTQITQQLYSAICEHLAQTVQSIMFGEPCSTVPLYKKKKQA